MGLLSKVHPLRTNTGVAQGGLNAPLAPDDSAERFAEDTLAAGDGLCDTDVVQTFAQEARREVIWAEQMGAPFNRDAEGRLDRRRFGSNSKNRTVYADDWTGHVVLQVLHEQFQRARVSAFDEWFVTSLLVDEGVCFGAIALGLRSGALEVFVAPSVVLATGGFTRLYAPSTASIGTTGDGQSLAFGAGAALRDMEMVQFHPTVFPGGHGLLITEAALSEGAQILDTKGQPISVAGLPRHEMCRAILDTLRNASGTPSLDATGLGSERVTERLPQTREIVRAVAGLDIAKEPVPIRPAAHRPMGGIETDIDGVTSLAGLFAAGECACNGLNGAGRLAGNTLTEAFVFGRRAGEAAAAYAKDTGRKDSAQARLNDEEKRLSSLTGGDSSGDSAGKIHAELAILMDERVGLNREATGLSQAVTQIHELKERCSRLSLKNSSRVYNYELSGYLEVGAMLNIAEVVALAAQARTESRGSHRRSDFPDKDDAQWRVHTVARLVQGAPQLDKKPVVADA